METDGFLLDCGRQLLELLTLSMCGDVCRETALAIGGFCLYYSPGKSSLASFLVWYTMQMSVPPKNTKILET